MDTAIVTTLIAGSFGIVTAAVTHFLPTLPFIHRLSSKTRHHSLIGNWESAWGPQPKGPTKHKEILKILKQTGNRVEGIIDREEEPNRKWQVEGRYDGLFLQLFYFPAADAKDTDFLSHGCYFFTRKQDGTFEGYSTGFGDWDDEKQREAGVSTDFHTLKRRR